MRYLYFLFVVACFPEFDDERAKLYIENPSEDYDGDGLKDAADCDDGNPNIRLEIRYYKDQDGDGFGMETESVLACPNAIPAGYIEEKTRNDEPLPLPSKIALFSAVRRCVV